MKLHKVLVLFFIISLTSCGIKGRFYGLYGYYEKAVSENPNLFVNTEDSNVNYLKDGRFKNKVLVTNGKYLKKYLIDSPYSIVYIWKPKCQSSVCIPLNLLENKCDSKSLDLFVVSEYYEAKRMAANTHLKNNIFGIDVKYYKSSLTKKYLSAFLADLTGVHSVNENNYLLFKYGIFQNSFSTFPEINY